MGSIVHNRFQKIADNVGKRQNTLTMPRSLEALKLMKDQISLMEAKV